MDSVKEMEIDGETDFLDERYTVCRVCGGWGRMHIFRKKIRDGKRIRMVNGAVYRMIAVDIYVHNGHRWTLPVYGGDGVGG